MMKVRVAPWIAVMFTVAGGAILLTGVVFGVLRDSSFWVLAAPGVAMALIGLLELGPLPYLHISDSRVLIPLLAFNPILAFFGLHSRKIGYRDRLYIEGTRLLYVRGGRREPPITLGRRFLAHHGDWDRMAAAKGYFGR